MELKFGLIGAGARSVSYATFFNAHPEYTLAAICDKNPKRFPIYLETQLKNGVCPDTYTDYRELLAREDLDAVIICTPDYEHCEIALAAIRSGKHILLEKPIEANEQEARQIYEASKNYPKSFALGFVLRYTPVYARVKEILDSNLLGELRTFYATENVAPAHAASFFRRWHRYHQNSGGLMNTKCCHDMDLLHWLVGSDPAQVCAFGGRRSFVPCPAAAEHCCDCFKKTDCIYAFDYTGYGDPANLNCAQDLCVYNSEKEIIDQESMLLQYQNGVQGVFTLNMLSAEGNRTLELRGTKATLYADLERRQIRVVPLAGEAVSYTLAPPVSGHGGGDSGLMGAFIRSIETGCPMNQAYDGYVASMTAFAGDCSMETGKIISINL